MKTLVISMSILLLVFFSFTPTFGQTEDANQAQPIEQKKEPVKKPEDKKTDDANVITDPNAVRTEIEKFEGLRQALNQINLASGNEISKWENNREEKLDLALAVQKQITKELKFLRELAVKEDAAKTTAAIDGILLDRQERFKNVTEKLEKETERYRRLAEREEKRRELREQRNRERAERTKRDIQR